MPVRSAPTIPPIPWTENTSRESSTSKRRLRRNVAQKHAAPAAMPTRSAPAGPTKPEAGVIATSPATTPVAAPSALGFPNRSHSVAIHARADADAATWVVSMAMPASPFAASALPALKPNQPTHRSEAPAMVKTRLWGGMGVAGNPRRRPTTRAAMSAATPALTWTTVPPA